MFANTGVFATPEGAAAVAVAAEDAGFESIWTVEHVLVPVGYESEYPYDRSGRMPGGEAVDLPDPLIWLAYVAARTTRIRLATGILILPQRNPAIVAKEVATLDVLSGGRVELGVGAGWLREEFAALGVPFERRGARLDASIRALRALWSEAQAEVHDEFHDIPPSVSRPKPVGGSVPIHIGGHTDAAARRAGRLGDGFFPGRGSRSRLERLFGEMRAAAMEAGRDPDAIELTTGSAGVFGADPVGAVEELAALGVDRVVVPPPSLDPAGIGAALADFGERVIARAG